MQSSHRRIAALLFLFVVSFSAALWLQSRSVAPTAMVDSSTTTSLAAAPNVAAVSAPGVPAAGLSRVDSSSKPAAVVAEPQAPARPANPDVDEFERSYRMPAECYTPTTRQQRVDCRRHKLDARRAYHLQSSAGSAATDTDRQD